MREIFAFIYDTLFGIFDPNYYLIFNHLYDNGGYTLMGFILILVPLLCWLLFYFLMTYPYGKLYHWFTVLLVTALVVFGFTYGAANTEIFSSNNQDLNNALSNSNYSDFASSLPIQYALINGLLTLIVGFLYSLFLKRFSKIQTHLPF